MMVLALAACGGGGGSNDAKCDSDLDCNVCAVCVDHACIASEEPACAPDTSEPDTSEPDTSEPDVPPTTNVTWTKDIQPILVNSCGGAGCHLDGQSGGSVNFDAYASSQEDSANVACYPGLKIGEVMALKVGPNPPCGIQMPIGKPLLEQPEQDLFTDWVNAGMPE